MGPACVAVAYSGGRDSSALLHATLAAAASFGIRVAALHVHHGLSPHADDWLAHCDAQCKRWAQRTDRLSFSSWRADGKPAAGESVEAWARTVRYRALRKMAIAQGASVVLLAHHRRDQAETLLLQALRGSGPAGLAGMPVSVVREGITWTRPWLNRPREDVDDYVVHHGLLCIEDDSNEDLRYARNRIRHQVWPVLLGAFPQAEASLADAAQRAHEAQECMAELAVQDLAPLVADAGDLNVKGWLALSSARRSNALRAWLKARAGRSAPASLVARLLAELRPSGNARWPLRGGELRVYRGVLRFFDLGAEKRGESRGNAAVQALEVALSIVDVGEFLLPGWGGCLHVTATREFGVPLAWLGRVDLKARSGAERFQAGLGRPPRSLKKQYQDKGVPAWDREGPLVYSGGQLVFAPGLGLDARVLALPGQEQVSLCWAPFAKGAAFISGPGFSGG